MYDNKEHNNTYFHQSQFRIACAISIIFILQNTKGKEAIRFYDFAISFDKKIIVVTSIK